MATIYIYTLSDPRSGQVRYVGKTVNPKKRFKSHLGSVLPSRKNNPRQRWIDELRTAGLQPGYTVIDECDSAVWEERERYWISYFGGPMNQLLNISKGGECVHDFSEVMRTVWANKSPVERAAWVKHNSRNLITDPETQRRRAQLPRPSQTIAMKRVWEERRAGLRETPNPDPLGKHSDDIKLAWARKTPEERKAWGAACTANIDRSSEAQSRKARLPRPSMAAKWQDPEFRAKQVARVKAYWAAKKAAKEQPI